MKILFALAWLCATTYAGTCVQNIVPVLEVLYSSPEISGYITYIDAPKGTPMSTVQRIFETMDENKNTDKQVEQLCGEIRRKADPSNMSCIEILADILPTTPYFSDMLRTLFEISWRHDGKDYADNSISVDVSDKLVTALSEFTTGDNPECKILAFPTVLHIHVNRQDGDHILMEIEPTLTLQDRVYWLYAVIVRDDTLQHGKPVAFIGTDSTCDTLSFAPRKDRQHYPEIISGYAQSRIIDLFYHRTDDQPGDRTCDLPDDLPDDVPADLPDVVPADLPDDLPDDVPADLPDVVPADLPDVVPDDPPTYCAHPKPSNGTANGNPRYDPPPAYYSNRPEDKTVVQNGYVFVEICSAYGAIIVAGMCILCLIGYIVYKRRSQSSEEKNKIAQVHQMRQTMNRV